MLKKASQTPKDETQLAQDVLINEVTEDLHNEQIMNMWKKYRVWILLAVIFVIGSIAAMEGYLSWRTKTRLAESDVYEQAAVLNAMGQTDAALAKYASLDNAKTDYRYLAKMRQAGILFEQGKDADALALLDALRQDKSAPQTIQAIAALGFVSHQIETGDVAILQSILNPYMTVGNKWYGTAVEMSILLLLRDGQSEKAIKMLNEALSMTNVPAGVKDRLSVLKKALEG